MNRGNLETLKPDLHLNEIIGIFTSDMHKEKTVSSTIVLQQEEAYLPPLTSGKGEQQVSGLYGEHTLGTLAIIGFESRPRN